MVCPIEHPPRLFIISRLCGIVFVERFIETGEIFIVVTIAVESENVKEVEGVKGSYRNIKKMTCCDVGS